MKGITLVRFLCGLFIAAVGFYLAVSAGPVPWWLGGAQGVVGLGIATEVVMGFRKRTKGLEE